MEFELISDRFASGFLKRQFDGYDLIGFDFRLLLYVQILFRVKPAQCDGLAMDVGQCQFNLRPRLRPFRMVLEADLCC